MDHSSSITTDTAVVVADNSLAKTVDANPTVVESIPLTGVFGPLRSKLSKYPSLTLYTVSFAQFLDIVNGASMTVAMLPIAEELAFEPSQMQWIISAYALAFAGLLLVAGRVGDLFGHRRVFLSGLFWFGLWSLINGFSGSPIMLCVSRALQGMGAAFTIPTALALISTNYPAGPERTKALSVFGAIGGMGAVTGLLLAGALVSTIGWQWIFRLSAILSAILWTVGFLGIPITRNVTLGQDRRIDFGGAITVTGGVVCVVYYISAGAEEGWASAQTLPVLFVGLALLALFFFIERKIAYPIMPFRIWSHRAFAASFVIVFVMQAQFQGLLYFSTLIFQQVLGYSIMRTALSYLVHGLVAVVVFGALGKFLPKLPLKPIIMTGFILQGVSAVMFAFVTPTTSYWALPFPALIIDVFGMGFVMLPAQISALSDAADADQGVTGALYNIGLQVGAPFGLAILTVISTNVNGVQQGPPGPHLMAGYKSGLFGDAVIGLIGFAITLLALPSINMSKMQPKLQDEESGSVENAESEMMEQTEFKSGKESEKVVEDSTITLANPGILGGAGAAVPAAVNDKIEVA